MKERLRAKVREIAERQVDRTGLHRGWKRVESETSTHYFYMQAHNFKLDDATVTESIYQSLRTAFKEDRIIIEAQQQLIASTAPAPMQSIAADQALVQYRRVVQQLIEAETAPPR